MHVGDRPHVGIDSRITAQLFVGGQCEVLPAAFGLSFALVEKRQIEVGVEEPSGQDFRWWVIRAGGGEHLFGSGFAGEQLKDLGHGHSWIAINGQHCRAGLVAVYCAGQTEVPPDGVFHVAVVKGLVKFELFGAASELAVVVERYAAFPLGRLTVWTKFDVSVEILNGLGHLSAAEAFPSPPVIGVGGGRVAGDPGGGEHHQRVPIAATIGDRQFPRGFSVVLGLDPRRSLGFGPTGNGGWRLGGSCPGVAHAQRHTQDDAGDHALASTERIKTSRGARC